MIRFAILQYILYYLFQRNKRQKNEVIYSKLDYSKKKELNLEKCVLFTSRDRNNAKGLRFAFVRTQDNLRGIHAASNSGKNTSRLVNTWLMILRY